MHDLVYFFSNFEGERDYQIVVKKGIYFRFRSLLLSGRGQACVCFEDSSQPKHFFLVQAQGIRGNQGSDKI